MAARSAWKGYLRLSLVSVPVKAYTATNSSNTIHLNQLHSTCHRRIKYQKVCPEHGEVSSDEIISGYEFAKDQYAVVDLDELKKLRTEGDKAINIDQFIRNDELDSRYQTGNCYFLLPDGPIGQQAYALIRDVMQQSNLQAVAQVVLSNKEQLVLLRPVEKLLGLFVLRYAADVKLPSAFEDELHDVRPSELELKLTKQLMDGLMGKEFDIHQYQDSYNQKLAALIQAKVEGKELVTPEAPVQPRVINLMDALKASLEQVKPGAQADKPPANRAASKTARERSGSSSSAAHKKRRRSG